MGSKKVQPVPTWAIVACPVSDCELRHVAGVGLLMVMKYIDKSEQLETGERTTLQALLDPEQALEIAEALKKSVQLLEFGKTLRKSLKKSMSTKMLKAPSADCPELVAAVSA